MRNKLTFFVDGPGGGGWKSVIYKTVKIIRIIIKITDLRHEYNGPERWHKLSVNNTNGPERWRGSGHILSVSLHHERGGAFNGVYSGCVISNWAVRTFSDD
jgi:hypothetical protein